MQEFPIIRPLSQNPEIDTVLKEAGGRPAHENWDRKETDNSDYVIGQSIIELKILEEERLNKREPQEKIAMLFNKREPSRPVVVIDPSVLTIDERRRYDQVMQGPIQTAVRKARKQLKQSREELNPKATTVLFVINNGITGITHEELIEIVARRAKNDTDEIDGVLVAGCYLHSDGFDAVALWPMSYLSINESRPFREYDELRSAWGNLAERHMTDFVRGLHGIDATKKPQRDIVFDWNGRTFVKPAVTFGVESKFYGARRPRSNHLRCEDVKQVALTIPKISSREFDRISSTLKDEPLMASFDTWNQYVESAIARENPELPVVPVSISRGSWEAWKRRNPETRGLDSLSAAANYHFCLQASKLAASAEEFNQKSAIPKDYIAVVTELIGQDEHNDVSHIGVSVGGKAEWIIRDMRKPYFGALALAAAHAVKRNISSIIWKHDLRYAWI